MLGTDGVDPARVDAVVHQGDQVGPDRVPLRAGEVTPGPVRADAEPEEHLGAVHVADAGQHLLVHQQCGDRRAAAGDPPPGELRVGVRAQRVRPEAGVHGGLLGPGEQLAGGRTAQVRVRVVVLQPEPDQADRRGGPAVGEGEPAVQAEVDVQPGALFEAEEEVLAGRLGPGQQLTVDQPGAVGEPPLRAGHPDGPLAEGVEVLRGQAVDDVAFGHGRSSPSGSAGRLQCRSRH